MQYSVIASALEVETGGSEIQSRHQVHRELEAKIYELFSQNKTNSNNNDEGKKRNGDRHVNKRYRSKNKRHHKKMRMM